MAPMAMYTCTSIGRVAGALNIYSSTAYHMPLVNEEAVLLLQRRRCRGRTNSFATQSLRGCRSEAKRPW